MPFIIFHIITSELYNMGNAKDIAMKTIMAKIPRKMLDVAFSPARFEDGRYDGSNMKYIIEQEVLNCYLYTLVSLHAGKIIDIPLKNSYHINTLQTYSNMQIGEGKYALYRIPPEVRNDSPIFEVVALNYPAILSDSPYTFNKASSSILDNANALLKSHAGGELQKPMVELLNGNIIKLSPPPYNHSDYILTCKVHFDDNLTNINNASIPKYAELAVIATKMYIYAEFAGYTDLPIFEGVSVAFINDLVSQWSSLDGDLKETLDSFIAATKQDLRTSATLWASMLGC